MMTMMMTMMMPIMTMMNVVAAVDDDSNYNDANMDVDDSTYSENVTF